MDLLTIGQMAQMNHVSEQTLRLYDRMGLLSPCVRGEGNGYRYYDIKQSALLDLIRYMKSLGMQLSEIKRHLDDHGLSDVESLLRQKQRQLDDEIKELKYQRRAIERTLESLERYNAAPPDGVISLEYIAKRLMYCVDSGVNFYDQPIDTYERILRDLQDSLVKDCLPQIYFCNAGSILRRENLIARRFCSTEVFVFVDREFVPDSLTVTVPAGNYLCIYCDSFNKEKEYALRLLDEIDRRGCQVGGDYLCEVIAELPLTDRNERGMFLRLQVPVLFR